ncbi:MULTISPECIES: DEAD/DEAH box helicase [unclassified Kaistella]|uniref:DEAD/DEAH box helicase n=1 Tax=unclassified Kaistella TaxID=2762626 RepID=UPI002735921B|nr:MULTISPECIES: DEAD/DEAH box helicase [unclassified Kaistella]MDP2452976.1 DEAD/DEAH box helicase [Kaistella sp. SH11-4b]MDP2455885.1 DEAD/DEAH box helicase [Kaistella sp. SH40-3]MDP2458789.1 DEAD/DEAH box helicase [Kaistella sp. SH19-2b]
MSTLISDLGIIHPLQNALRDLEITVATDIQEQVMPIIINETEDIVALAKTGTGKTAAFGLPLLQLVEVENKNIQTLVLAPTRELAQQIYNNLTEFAKYLPEVSIVLLTGGNTVKSQVEELKATPQMVVATPGRFLDLLEKGALDIRSLKRLVLDEADEMLQALKDDLMPILKAMPKNRRTFLFSATMPGELKDIVHNYMSKNAVSIGSDMATIGHEGIDHQYIVVDPIEKFDVLLHFLNSQEGGRGIIFCKTKAAVNKLAKNLAIRKISSGALHGSLTQGIRDRIMDQFREGYIDILVATDLVARGIDVKELAYVVNYHLPDTHEAYVHRSGRTGRAGAKGLSMTIIQQEEVKEIAGFEQELGIKFHPVKKADAEAIEWNNTLVWAKKVFKTKPNREVPEEVRQQVKTIFHHLTKEELVDKVLANYLAENS